jgi:uncharacterized surface protein with fasciclin (FAS1) repeats
MKNNIRYNRNSQVALVLVLLMGVATIRCSDPEIETSTNEDVLITGYLEKNVDQYSQFLEILQLSGNSGFLGAYGTYTCFVPTNEAVQTYLQEKGLSAVSELDVNEMKKLVRFHVIQDTLSTTSFTDGKLQQPTMYGEFLTTGAVNVEGSSFVRINRQANIIESNIRTANGLIHVIDHVLQPASLTLAQMLENDPDYSIFLQAVQETGFYDKLNTIDTEDDGTTSWLTLIAQTNSVFINSGFADYESVKARYSHTGDPTDPNDSLYLFVAYRILPDIKYTADLVTAPSHPTLAPQEVITTRLDGEIVRINADLFRGVQEPGAVIDREKSDYAATNGVLHSSGDNYSIKIRLPYSVHWDLADQPELRLMVNDFRKPGRTVNITLGMLKDVTWGGATTNTLQYVTNSATSTDPYVYGDRLTMNIRTGVIPWVEFITPLLVKGKYKVWICYRYTRYNDMQAFFDEVPLPRIFGLNVSPNPYPTTFTPDEAEGQGWKLYTGSANTAWTARMIGTIDVTTTDRHKFKILGLTNRGGSTGNPFLSDMVHFIPIGEDQVYPRFNMDGTLVDRP